MNFYYIQMVDTKCMDLADRKIYEKFQCNTWINEFLLHTNGWHKMYGFGR